MTSIKNKNLKKIVTATPAGTMSERGKKVFSPSSWHMHACDSSDASVSSWSSNLQTSHLPPGW